MIDTLRLDWLEQDPDRLRDAFYRVENEGCTVREAIDWLTDCPATRAKSSPPPVTEP